MDHRYLRPAVPPEKKQRVSIPHTCHQHCLDIFKQYTWNFLAMSATMWDFTAGSLVTLHFTRSTLISSGAWLITGQNFHLTKNNICSLHIILHWLQRLYITSFVTSLARACARWALKVLFPTPPFPDNTRILCLTVDSFAPISAIAGGYK